MLRAATLFLLISINIATAQEWKSLGAYRKETGKTALSEGCWLKKDRKKKTETWKQANKYNLGREDGHLRYKNISQVRDFYLWFDGERKRMGHEIQWFGVTAVVESQFSKLDSWVVRTFIVGNKEVKNFAQEGTKKVFEYAFPQMKSLYFSGDSLTGKAAKEWDLQYGTGEQCVILEPFYKKFSPRAAKKLERIARRKGLYGLAIPKALTFEGDLNDCHARVDYAIKKVLPFSLQQKQ